MNLGLKNFGLEYPDCIGCRKFSTPEIWKVLFEKFMVEEIMVEKSGVEKSGVEKFGVEISVIALENPSSSGKKT